MKYRPFIKRVKYKYKYRPHKWYNKLPWILVSREIANALDFACDRGIDFGDMSIKEFAWYYLRDHNCKWMYPLLSYKVMEEEHELNMIRKAYE